MSCWIAPYPFCILITTVEKGAALTVINIEPEKTPQCFPRNLPMQFSEIILASYIYKLLGLNSTITLLVSKQFINGFVRSKIATMKNLSPNPQTNMNYCDRISQGRTLTGFLYRFLYIVSKQYRREKEKPALKSSPTKKKNNNVAITSRRALSFPRILAMEVIALLVLSLYLLRLHQ